MPIATASSDAEGSLTVLIPSMQRQSRGTSGGSAVVIAPFFALVTAVAWPQRRSRLRKARRAKTAGHAVVP